MAKKYYWLKLKEDFFDDDTISFIEEQENGVYYVNFYLKLCLKSVKTEGKLIRLIGENLIPYDVKSLSKLTGVPVDTVVVAMKLFESIGLVKILETGEIYLSQINELIGTETDKARIMRQKRAVQKLDGNNVTTLLPRCYPEKEEEEEK
ncbi:MAG TPA: phage replisome organizer N-terminal domain-containing protein, partial [Candidatus Butyricicoccus avistercoris]|nr:phage replisome organizer N-terminal domain-containing protein [Candidatus Butyricicoccus avistercoris]